MLITFSVVIPVFLIVFKPFGLSNSTCDWLILVLSGLSIPIFITLAINFYGIASLLPKFFNEHSWSIWKEGVWGLWNFMTIVVTTGYYWTIVPVCSTPSIHFKEQLLRVFLIGLLPGMICIYFNYSRALKSKLKKAQKLNEKLQAKVSYYEHGELKLVSENNSEVVNLSTSDLILIQSYDNYAKIVIGDDSKTSYKLIRSSLKHLEPQIEYQFIVRCHRSFIVNLAKVKTVAGNARDFRVKLENYQDWIPVSREAYRKIAILFEEYSPKPGSFISYSSDESKSRL